jgi:hypothetical protein
MNEKSIIVGVIEASRLISLGEKVVLTPLFCVAFLQFAECTPYEMRSETKESVFQRFHLILHLALVHPQTIRGRQVTNASAACGFG